MNTEKPTTKISPASLVLERCRAFSRQDFGFVYDSYHPDAPFLEAFPDRSAYLEFAREQLAGAMEILECRVLKERLEGSRARVIFLLEIRHQGQRIQTLECCRLLLHQGTWRYLHGQKVPRQQWDKPVEDVDFSDFDVLSDTVLI